jgi:thiol-disulfide isomerase/thioredoxin
LAGEPIMDTLDLLAVEVLGPIDREAADRALERAARSSQPAVAARAAVLRRQRDVFTKPLEFKFTAVDGREVDLTALRGRVVLVDFWATWCPPCVAEMPKLVELYTGYQSRGFEIVGISLDQSRKTLTDYIERHGLKWPHYFDGNGWGNSLSSGWGIESIPTKWLVDKAGHVQAVAAETDLEAEIKRLLSQ